ncbi:hypothetical protein BGX28_004194 [Mortierella sp. GBA30]|nr:hypothetical protein BGX28_004194 [Mortierella sp. GBA30]
MSLDRTILILDHSISARTRPCYNLSKGDANSDQEDDELDLAPCSVWAAIVNAALQYMRLSLELAPIGQKTQVSVHVASGAVSMDDSVVLNTWTDSEQSLTHVTSQLQLLQQQDSATKATSDGDISRLDWIEQALKGAIAHILEPTPHSTAQTQPGSTIPASYMGTPSHPRKTSNIVMLLLDPEGHVDDDDDMYSDLDGLDDGWQYAGQDLRKILGSAIRSLQDFLWSTRASTINVDFVRISTSHIRPREDIVKEEIARCCTASVYTIIAENELSSTRALTNHYLLRNKDIRLARIYGLPLNPAPGELFYRTDHIRMLAQKQADISKTHTTGILQRVPSFMREETVLNYGAKCETRSDILPTRCAHVASISPKTFSSSFASFVSGAVHLLRDEKSEDIASAALFDHYGRLFIHCLQTSKDSNTLSPIPTSKRKNDDVFRDSRLDDFLQVVIRPNTISPNTEEFVQDGNIFTEITPSALPNATLDIDDSNDNYTASSTTEASSSRGVNMALVHTTSKLDLETRWLVQWEGERLHPILPAHEVHIKMFRAAICRSTVDALGFSTIQSVLDTLISDARPPLLGEQQHPAPQGKEGKIFQQAARVRESAQAILADLWMIGQRFKSVSLSHVEAARLIATKITPKGVDHQTVKLTLVPPNRRAELLNEMLTGQRGGGPVATGNSRGNDTGFGRGGRGGGGRFEFGRGGRGRGVGGAGGFRGGQGSNTGSPGSGNSTNSPNNSADDMNFGGMDPSVPAGPMLSLTGKTQPKPYLETRPPTRKEIEESEQEYLGQLGEDGCLLKAYWGSRGAQGSSIAAVLNSVTSLDSISFAKTAKGPLDPLLGTKQQRTGGIGTKRLRLQDFAGRTPIAENGGHSHGQI